MPTTLLIGQTSGVTVIAATPICLLGGYLILMLNLRKTQIIIHVCRDRKILK